MNLLEVTENGHEGGVGGVTGKHDDDMSRSGRVHGLDAVGEADALGTETELAHLDDRTYEKDMSVAQIVETPGLFLGSSTPILQGRSRLSCSLTEGETRSVRWWRRVIAVDLTFIPSSRSRIV